MLKNPNYVYGGTDFKVPGHLNFGDYIITKLWALKDKMMMLDTSTDKISTYGEIAQHSMNFAISLSRMGLRKGHVIGLMSENRMEFWGAVFGAACTGAAVTTISPVYAKDELKNALNISKPKILICSPSAYNSHKNTLETLPFLEKIIIFGTEIHRNTILYNDLSVYVKEPVTYKDFKAADVDGQTDTLFIVYSSGTTGLPKGVKLTHLNILTACSLPNSFEDAPMMAISPWYHVMGLVGFICGAALGRSVVFMPKFDMNLYLKTIEKYKISQLTVVPPVIIAVCKWPGTYDLSSVKIIYSGAAPLHKETLDEVYQKFPNLVALLQGYGASETTLGVIKFALNECEVGRRKPGSVGRVVHGTTIKVADIESRKAVGPNRRGELCVKGGMLMKGYIGIGPSDDFDEEGFYKTGDIGYYDEEGCFYVVDRLKELIKYKGFQVPPAELEALLLTHPAVKDVGVIGVPHKKGGEVPLAYIVAHPNTVTEKELQDYVAERLSNPKHLRGGIRFIDQIPKSASGKILRKDLRQLHKAGRSKL